MNKCVCLEGYYLINGACQKCSESQIYDEFLRKCVDKCDAPHEVYSSFYGRCVCSDNYFMVNGKCLICPLGESYYMLPSGTGKCFPTCPTRQYFNPMTTRCECSEGYYNISGNCDVCSPSQTYEPVRQICIKKCPVNMVYNMLRGECVCI